MIVTILLAAVNVKEPMLSVKVSAQGSPAVVEVNLATDVEELAPPIFGFATISRTGSEKLLSVVQTQLAPNPVDSKSISSRL